MDDIRQKIEEKGGYKIQGQMLKIDSEYGERGAEPGPPCINGNNRPQNEAESDTIVLKMAMINENQCRLE